MYSSRGSNAYGQQSYSAQQAYGQNSGSAYPGSSIGGADGASQLSMPSRHSSMLGSSQEADIGGYRAHPSTAAHYGGQYGALYGSSTSSNAQQVSALTGKGAGSSALQGRTAYASAMEESPKFASVDYVSSSSHGYGQKGDQYSSGKMSDYPSIDRRNYGEQSAYIGRDLQSEPTRRYADSVGLGHQHQPEMYDHIDQASLLRQQQMLKSQSMQSASLDGSARPTDYLAARGATTIRHATQDLTSYGARMDVDPRNLSMLSGSYGAQHQASILGAAPRRNVDDLMYAQSSAGAGYGVSLPPGRDYATGKGLRGSLESDYPGSLMTHSGHPSVGGSRIDERKDDRGGYRRDLEIREEERRRERDREKEREREKDRERERERERERARERKRLLERRDKERERERERKIGTEIKRERTPPKITKDQRGPSLVREEKSVRRDSPRHEALHRRHSPIREKRREYICKVYPSCLVDIERDYLSINKRYPKLSISPEFCKVVVNWSRENLKLSLHTPVSFEHDLVEIESSAEQKEPSTKPLVEESGKSRCGSTVWNAKVILMSGISRDALEELSSDKSFDDRIPHINNILRFAFLRKDRSFMAIGGPCNVVDGGYPLVNDSLIQTAMRYAKDLTQLDLHNCQHWNRFLEIHYDRVGKDGLFSHKEITVLFIPDLSECLPSLNAWRDQWLAHKKNVIERERHLALLKEKKSSEEVVKGVQSHIKSGKDNDSPKSVKQSHNKLAEQPVDGKKTGKEGGKEMQENDKKIQDKDVGDVGGDGQHAEKKEEESVQKPGKKKIIKKVVKQKAVKKKIGGEDTPSKESKKMDDKDVADKLDKLDKPEQEITVQQDGASVDPASVKIFARKKIVKKVPVGKSAEKEKGLNADEMQTDKDKIDSQEVGVKKSGKKKIIRRVPKKKAAEVDDKGASADGKKDGDKDENKVVQKGSEIEKMKEQAANANKPVIEGKKAESKISSKMESKIKSAEKQEEGGIVSEKEIKDVKVGKKEGNGMNDKKTEATKEKGSGKDGHTGKRERTKDEKEKNIKDGKDESRHKSSKELREKGKLEEPPKQPGLILQTKWSKDSKLRSTSLSLDSLLDYNDKDIEESTFELSLFAESLYEMLQYQMGCRLLSFLQKLRLNFVNKRNQRKRQRDETPQNGSDKGNSARKRLKKTAELPVKSEPVKSEKLDAANPDHESTVEKEVSVKSETLDASNPDYEATVAKEGDASADGDDDDSKMNNETDDYDPEEEEDEDQEMDDASHHNDASKEVGDEDKKTDLKAKLEKEITEEKDETKESVEGDKIEEATAEEGDNSNVEKSKDKEVKVEATDEKDEKAKTAVKEPTVIHKELLQAFRFFDRNRVGYIKVEDLRLIIHNLGKFLSHRDVKELVQSALLESNTARDNRILYNKLVKMSDI